jgi:hypothetical protein
MKISYTTEHVKSLTKLLLFEYSTTAELFRFLLKNKRIVTDKLSSGYFTRCVINGARNNENAVDIANALIIDCDSQIDADGNVIAGAVAPFEPHSVLNHLGIDHLITSSHSNTADVRKYRIIIPCQYTRHQLPIILDWLFARFHENDVMLADVKENRSWAQAWFMPSCHPERQHLFKTFWRVDGKSSNPLRDDTEIEFVPSECFWVERIVREHQATVNESIPERPSLARVPVTNLSANPIEAFNANFSVHDVLIRNGYKQQGKRYLHPNSASKIAGVRILERGAFSDSNDALNDGRCHDAFDCYRLLECGGDMRQALNWNSDITRANRRAFFDMPDTQKPIKNKSESAQCLVESLNVRRSQTSNSQFQPQ